jgi:hypothetical protein
MLDRRDAALAHPHASRKFGLCNAKPSAHLRQAPGTLLGSQLFHPGGYGSLVPVVGEELVQELVAALVLVAGLCVAHWLASCFR